MSYFNDDYKNPMNKVSLEKLKKFEKTFSFSDKEYNKQLCEKYPFLIPRNLWSGMRITEAQNGGYWPGEPGAIPEYDYEYTELDDMPKGWRIAFGEQMCEELKQELIKFNYLDDYEITQVKEKWGSLRWYDNGHPIGKLELIGVEEYEDGMPQHNQETDFYRYVGVSKNNKLQYKHYKIIDKCKIQDIISKYEKISARTCIECGKPATKISLGWISPWCDDCSSKIHDHFMDINDYFSEVTDEET